MYINPFLAGVLATIGVEMAVVLVGSLISVWKDGRKK